MKTNLVVQNKWITRFVLFIGNLQIGHQSVSLLPESAQ